VTADPSVGSDLAPLPTQQILATDPNLLDHCLVLSSFNHDNKINPKEAEIESPRFEQLKPRQQDQSKGNQDQNCEERKLEIGYDQFC